MNDSVMQRYSCENQHFSAEEVCSPAVQEMLARARSAGKIPRCLCLTSGVPMVIRQLPKQLILARWPETGTHHHHDCPSYDIESTCEAVRECDDGTLDVRLSFQLKRPHATPVGLENDDLSSREHRASESPVQPRESLGLVDLLRELWHVAELNKWHPGMQGKRNWSVVRYRLLNAATRIHSGSWQMDKHLFIPESFRKQDPAHTAQQVSELKELANQHGQALLIAPLRSLSLSEFSNRLQFTHLDISGFAKNNFGLDAGLKKLAEKDRLIAIAIVSNAKKNLKIHSIAGFPVTAAWLPYHDRVEASVFDWLVSEKRRFFVRTRITPDEPDFAVSIDHQGNIANFITDPATDAGWRVV